MESKDLLITITGIIGSLVTTIIINLILKSNTINILFSLIGLLAVFILTISYLLYKKITEIEEVYEKQEIEQKRLNEKLKIHEQLVDIKKDIEILKQRTKK